MHAVHVTNMYSPFLRRCSPHSTHPLRWSSTGSQGGALGTDTTRSPPTAEQKTQSHVCLPLPLLFSLLNLPHPPSLPSTLPPSLAHSSLLPHLMCVCSDGHPKRPGQPEVRQLDDPLHIDEQVLWLQVSVQHSVGVAEVDPIQHLIGVALEGGRGERSYQYTTETSSS